MKNLIRFIVVFICCLHLSSAFAWGRKGHSIVAEIAFHNLSKEDSAKIMSYLQGMTLAAAANYMDDVRSDPKYSYTSTWHYLNIPKGGLYIPNDSANIVNALNATIDDLKTNGQLTQGQISLDLLIVIHLIGDLNQPLHVGYASDKGGNNYQVSYFGKGSNLHKVWDSQIIEDWKINFQQCLYEAEHLTDDEQKVASELNVVDWMEASRQFTSPIYPLNHKIDSSYVRDKLSLIKHQLGMAGNELALALHEIAQHIPDAQKDSAQPEKVSEVPLDSLANHIGEIVHVCGKVYGVKYISEGSKPTFVNVGADYPNSPLTLFINDDVRNTFSYKPEEKLNGKDICVTGKLELYKGKPEIVMKKESEIVILSK